MKTKKILKSIVSLLLVVMMLMSVGIASISSAVVELAQTGATVTYQAGEYIYIKNFVPSGWGSTTWILNNSYAWAHMWGGTAGTQDYLFELYSGTAGASGAIYRAKVTTGGTYTNVIFTRNSTNKGPWTDTWNQTGDIVLSSSNYNCWTSFTSGGTGKTGSHYAVAPSSVTATVTNAKGGSGTSSDPYLVDPGASYTVKLTGVKADPGMEGFGFNLDSTSSKNSTTDTTWTTTKTASSTAGTTTTHVGYAWNYEYSTSYYSSSYATSNTIYVKTVASNVTATFKDKDGNTIGTPQTITSGETPTAPTAPTVAGHTFTGWLSSADNEVYASNNLPAITGDTTFTAQYSKNSYTVTATAATGGTVTGGGSYEYESVATLKAEATLDGYVFTGWTLSGGYQITEGSNTSATIKIKVTGAVTATANFQQIPTNSVSVTANPPEAGTVSPVQQDVAEGSNVVLTAVPNTGYTFTGWSITGSYTIQSGTVNSQAFSIIPQAEITAQANFRANTATVTVNAQSGGTVTNAGAKATEYPDTVTSTAAESTGYTFAGWTITGTLGTDYELVNCSASDKTITIRPIKDGASITATAKFLLGQYLTVYTFSEDGYDNLTVTESNGTTTKTVFDDEQSGVEYFGEVEWLRSDENMELTNGYSSSVTAVLSSASGNGNDYNEDNNTFLVKDGYRTIVFTNGWAWSEPTLHHWIDGGAGTSWPGEKMQKVGQNSDGQDIYVLYIPNDRQKVVFNGTNENFQQSDDIVLPAGSNDVLAYYIQGSKANGRPDVVLWPTQPGTHTPSSGDIDLTSTLYTDGTWANVDRVWIYQSGSTEIVTLRSELLEAIADSESDFTAGNDGKWTEESWSEFVAAYNTAVSTVGAGDSTQAAIDAAAADLIAKKAALATQEKVSLTVTQQGATGTVSFGNVTIDTATGTGDVNKGKPVTLNIAAPNMYYISGIIVNGESVFTNDAESLLEKEYTTSALSADNNYITVIYTARTTYTITVEAYGQDGGSLYFNGELIPAAGNVYTVCSGDNVTITAEPADGYGVYYWVVDSTSGNNRELSYSFNNVSKNHTIDVEWVKLQQVNISVVTKPNAAGTSTVNGSSSATVMQYDTVTLVTVNDDPCYQFIGWTIDGSYIAAEGTTKNDATFKIIANGGEIKATANYDKVYKAIYLDNAAGWEQPHIYSWGSSSPVTAWPGDKMTYDSTLEWWVGYVPLDATSVQFNDGTNQNQKEFVIGTNNLFTNGTNTTDYPAPYVEVGYYLQGTWNGSSHSAFDLVKFEEQADDTYTLELTVTKTADGYIYVNPTNENSHFWNAATNGATGNPQTLTATGAYQSSPNQVKIEIDTTDFNKAYDLVITFNPKTGEFSWTKAENVPTIDVIATDGRGKNEADVNMDSGNGRVGKTYFDIDT
ncbi:MAG: starch-binding protein, partial [Ruminococcus sp.]|nr:starch-binding protein [Ruminococcus sp.]